ncbi:MAG: TAT-variant-translocated molybdopterin oxidoreductase [Deltaproteobacteria bacterium]|nr:TAT-variant-translocated molybdopterin oxidoreductase [Deltaproteobacteria bacterium]
MTTYWKSLEELAKDPAFEAASHKEFLHTPEELAEEDLQDEKSGVTRRDFLRLMGASMVMASAAACTRRPVEKIIPYLNKPLELTVGVPNWYATTCFECPSTCGVLAKTREGRPIKLEGNAEHPMNKGGMCARGQASLLNLYDPDRLRAPLEKRNGSWEASSWDKVDENLSAIFKQLQDKKGKVRLLTGYITSPATRQLIQEFLSRFENAKHIEFEPLSTEELASAQSASYGGAPVIPHYRFEKAKVLVSFGAEFLDTWLSPVEFTRAFSKTRKLKNGQMSKFVCFDPSASLTGSNADLHVPVRPGDELKLALALAHELVVLKKHSPFAYDSGIVSLLTPYSIETVAKETGVDAKMLQALAASLWQHQGESLVLGGGYSSRAKEGEALHVVVNFINSVLGNDGITLDALNSPSLQSGGSFAALNLLIDEMADAQVDLLFIYKTNPSYTVSAGFKFEAALKRVPVVISFADRVDETALLAGWVLPDNHYLESWNDAQPQKGLYSLAQPTIAPLWDTRSFQESLLKWGFTPAVGAPLNWHAYLKNYWDQNIYRRYGTLSSFQTFWESVLREGVLDTRKTSATHAPRTFNAEALRGIATPVVGNALTTRLVVYPSIPHYDGRSGNNSWLMELPDPVTKITWQNYVSVSPSKAVQLNVQEGDVLKLKTASFEAELPVHIQPGLHDDALTVPLGFGHTQIGRVADKIGVNAFQYLSKKEGGVSFVSDVTTSRTGKWIHLASTQADDTLHGRPIIRETTLEEFTKNPKAGNEAGIVPLPSMWSGHKYEGYRWGMSIDLNSCTGCSACVIACQAENNIPVVGEKQIRKGRTMHWLRIDRYYSGDKTENPKVFHQPMLCQHCENAPCETVCPVIATMHDDEGLNVQVYNRCVGTRYCANNCPYKVRQFNWFEYLRNTPTPLSMVMNPDVTVREKGVMEKCTFCTQRIQEAKNKAKDFDRKVEESELKTACQQSCPAEAIVFGDINNPDTAVSRLSKNPRGYHVLEDLNTKPSITYLTKVRNV